MQEKDQLVAFIRTRMGYPHLDWGGMRPLPWPDWGWTRSLGMCPDWESKSQPFGYRMMLQPLSHFRQGRSPYFLALVNIINEIIFWWIQRVWTFTTIKNALNFCFLFVLGNSSIFQSFRSFPGPSSTTGWVTGTDTRLAVLHKLWPHCCPSTFSTNVHSWVPGVLDGTKDQLTVREGKAKFPLWPMVMPFSEKANYVSVTVFAIILLSSHTHTYTQNIRNTPNSGSRAWPLVSQNRNVIFPLLTKMI